MTLPTVLIVGAGPVGLVSALVLAKAGIPVRVLERSPTLPRDMRASTFHPPTLDMLSRFGITEDLVSEGLVARLTQQWDRQEGLVAQFDMQMLEDETMHPFRLQCEQWKLIELLAERLLMQPGAELVLGAEAIEVNQTSDGVRVTANCQGVATVHEGAYLIGADGAWSTVRQQLNIDFPGFTYPERFLFVSTDFDYAKRFDGISYVNYFSDPEQWCVLLRVPSMWRVLFPVSEDYSDEQVLSDDSVQEHLQRLAPVRGQHRTMHRTIYKVHQRVAHSFRLGRVLLAGDAAHINNPLGGMGMNGGVHDAFNLADKLVEIIKHGAAEDLLDRYERQRRTIAEEYINAGTALNKKYIEESDPAKRRENISELRRVAANPSTAKQYLRKTSMIDAIARAELIQ